MNLKDSEKPKVLMLVCGIVGVMGVIMVRFNAMTAPRPQQPAEITMDQPQQGRAQTIFASNENSLIVLPPDAPVTSINPFRRILPDPNGTPTRPTTTVTVTRPQPSVGYFPKLPRELGTGSVLPVQLSANELPKPEFTLDGVLTGADPVAVLKVGTTTQVVGLGQQVMGYKVKAITDTSVKLQRDKEVLILTLGQGR
ncbi:MAG: hypothetical protein ACAH95_02885 [Fimbriimonas sp.]